MQQYRALSDNAGMTSKESLICLKIIAELPLLSIDSMEPGQVDEDDVQVTSGDDHPLPSSTTQTIKGRKALATPAVRRLAMENSVSSVLSYLVYVNYDLFDGMVHRSL